MAIGDREMLSGECGGHGGCAVDGMGGGGGWREKD
jgi:hypothetical protein